MRTRLIVAGVIVGAALALNACAPAARVEGPETTPTTPAAAAIATSAAGVEALSPDAKAATIDPSFPVEVPVPQGDFTRAETQGGDAWDYTVEVAAAPRALLDWYVAAYGARNWQLVDQKATADGKGVTIVLRKNSAESRVTVSADSAAGPSVAEVVVGVGAPVIQAQ